MSILKQTLAKFGYPNTLVKEYKNWLWLVRPHQVTLGSSIIISKHDATNFSDLDESSFAELKMVVLDVERSLKRNINYEKINYLMLMMQDPVVHYHVLPRYEGVREKFGVDFVDTGFPGVPELSNYVEIDEKKIQTLINVLNEK